MTRSRPRHAGHGDRQLTRKGAGVWQLKRRETRQVKKVIIEGKGKGGHGGEGRIGVVRGCGGGGAVNVAVGVAGGGVYGEVIAKLIAELEQS